MQIVYKQVADLIPYVNNARKNDQAVDAVASSIKNYGFKQPIVIDSQGEIVAGHTRLKAAKKLGLKEIPVIIADDLTPAQVKAYRIADNRVGELAEWDMDLLQLELSDIEEFTGFEELNLDGEDEEIDLDYSNKNKEIETGIFNEFMEIKLKFSKEDFHFVRKKLLENGETLEKGLMVLINE
jgi:site-specific DNA-methyltransferase (adenine-specific)